MRKLVVILSASTILLLAGGTAPTEASAAKRAVPQGFLGVDLDPGETDLAGVDINAQLDAAAAAGVESIRFPLYWFRIQPFSSPSDVPIGQTDNFTADPTDPTGAPYDWTKLDAWVGAAASRGIRLFPSVMGAPDWAADPNFPVYKSWAQNRTLHMGVPEDFDQFGAFVATLAGRYGSNGTYWTAHPSITKVPVAQWQIWNEPNFDYYWPQHDSECVPSTKMSTTPSPCPSVTITGLDRKPLVVNLPTLAAPLKATLDANPKLWTAVDTALLKKKLKRPHWAPSFVKMLKTIKPKVKQIDPSAKVVLASLTNMGWIDLATIYSVGGRGSFDMIGVNMFVLVSNTAKLVKFYRDALKKGGDSSIPLVITEFSWASGLGLLAADNKMKTIITTPAGQAKNLGLQIDQLVKVSSASKVTGAFWYRWASPNASTTDVWDWTGLNQVRLGTVTNTATLDTFRGRAMKIEACKTKVLASSCKTK